MRNKKITEVFTIIYKGRQLVGLQVEGMDKYIFLSPGNIKQCTGVGIAEVEILTGSTISPELYQIGEKMFSGKIYNGDRPIIKDFWIECEGSIEQMRNRNSDKLNPLQEIRKVFQFNRNGKNIVGFDTGREKATFINSSRLEKLTLLTPDEFHILEGSFINPVYYQEGEELSGGGNCYKSGVILKALNLRYYGKVEEMHERFENTQPTYSIGNYDRYDDDCGYDSNNWLSDAAGSDDPELMSAAFWNMY